MDGQREEAEHHEHFEAADASFHFSALLASHSRLVLAQPYAPGRTMERPRTSGRRAIFCHRRSGLSAPAIEQAPSVPLNRYAATSAPWDACNPCCDQTAHSKQE